MAEQHERNDAERPCVGVEGGLLWCVRRSVGKSCAYNSALCVLSIATHDGRDCQLYVEYSAVFVCVNVRSQKCDRREFVVIFFFPSH